MPRGGARPGAGRKPGTVGRRSTLIATQILKGGGKTPLDVMIEAMRLHYEAGDLDKAAAIAKDAAPYVHARLAAVEHSGDVATTYVVEMPAQHTDADAWRKEHAPPTRPLQ